MHFLSFCKLNTKKRLFVKSALRKFKRFIKSPKLTSLNELKYLLTEKIGLQKGDYIIVSSSFGNLCADFSPRELINMLQEIITYDGLIMMPYYPPVKSTEWAETHQIFDMEQTKSGMGILTNIFKNMPDVHMSIHPCKAVCAWGRESLTIIENHQKEVFPFSKNSPYGRMLTKGSKSLCLGIHNIPIIHAIDDATLDDPTYTYNKNKNHLAVRLTDGNMIEVPTYLHNEKVMNSCMTPGYFVRDLRLSSYKRIPLALNYITIFDNIELLQRLRTINRFSKFHHEKISSDT